MTTLPAQTSELEAVIITDALSHRAARSPDYERENAALIALAQHMADAPEDILQNVAQAAINLCGSGSAGISIEEKGTIFRWHGLAGELASHRWETTPRDFSPCGAVVDQNATLLMYRLERHYPYFAEVRPAIVEALLVPFSVGGTIVGTVWVVTHDEEHKFDAEDKRVVGNLAKFAAAAYQARTCFEALNDSARRKDEFLAMLGHELRNPLFPLQNAVRYLVENSSPDDGAQRATAVLDRQLKHMKRLIDDLLDASRITQGKIELRKEGIELSAIMKDAFDASRPLMDASKHDFEMTLPAEPVYLTADPVRLTQILNNLLANAAKYTPEKGRIRLLLSVEEGTAIIRVQDNGIGIANDKLDSIFELFSQVDASAERSHGGLGVGLALVKYLVEAHAGSIEARSEGRGKGSEFVLRLQVDAVSTVVLPIALTQAPKNAIDAHSLRILIADDNRDAADILAMLLKLDGHQIWTVYDGPDAIKTARECRPHVVLSDLGMPGMNGYETARCLRDDPITRDCVLVAVTGYAQADNEKRIENAGFDHHLIKPVEFEVLQELLASVDVVQATLLPAAA